MTMMRWPDLQVMRLRGGGCRSRSPSRSRGSSPPPGEGGYDRSTPRGRGRSRCRSRDRHHSRSPRRRSGSRDRSPPRKQGSGRDFPAHAVKEESSHPAGTYDVDVTDDAESRISSKKSTMVITEGAKDALNIHMDIEQVLLCCENLLYPYQIEHKH